MPLAKELKKGSIVEVDGAPCAVERIEVKAPSARGAATLYKIRFRNLADGSKVDRTFDGPDLVKDADFARRPVQYLYNDGTDWHFMDDENGQQFAFTRERLGDAVGYLVENMPGLTYLLHNDQPIGIQLPPVIESEIVETTPAVKGSSATGRTKPATLATGLVVQVPEYLTTGETVRIDTSDGSFVARVDASK